MALLVENLQEQLKAKDQQITALTGQVSGLNNYIQTLIQTITCLPVGSSGGSGGGGGGRVDTRGKKGSRKLTGIDSHVDMIHLE